MTFAFLVGSRKLDVNGAEEHEYGSLEEADENLQKVEGQGNGYGHDVTHPGWKLELVAQSDHGRKQVFARKNVTIETKREGDGSEGHRDNLDHTDKEENRNENEGHEAGQTAFDSKNVAEEIFDTHFGERPVEPENHEHG